MKILSHLLFSHSMLSILVVFYYNKPHMSENDRPDVPEYREAENTVLTYSLATGIERALYSDAPITFRIPNKDHAGVYDFDRFLPLRSRDNRYILALNYSFDAI